MKKRIWFNNWFNTAYHIINLIKQNGETEFEIFGTNRNPYSAVLSACDHSGVEEVMDEESYIDFCLDFCRKNSINIFIPRSNMTEIAKNAKRFSELGTNLLICCDSENLNILSDKARFYEALKGNSNFNIPEYRVVNNAADFEKAYYDIEGKGHRVCFKPVLSEGAAGFRIIDQNADSIDSLFSVSGYKVSLESVMKKLSQRKNFRDTMVMEYIGGYEYSIDCLAYNGKLLTAVPRKKVDGRVRLLEESRELTEMAREMTRIFNLSYVFNIQVRFDGDCPKLLEVNPRMSGGIWISCFSGVNFPYLAVKLLLEGDSGIEMLQPEFGVMVSQIEKEIYLNCK